MPELTQKELLINIVEMQTKQSNDITEIKTCLLGDKYHPEGVIADVKRNGECIQNIKINRIPDMEIKVERRIGAVERSIEKRSGLIGGVVAFIMVVATSVVNYLIFKR